MQKIEEIPILFSIVSKEIKRRTFRERSGWKFAGWNCKTNVKIY